MEERSEQLRTPAGGRAGGASRGLFRGEVYQARKGEWLGSVQLSAVRLGWPMAILAGTLVLALAAALTFGSHARKVAVSGRLLPEGGVADVLATASGVVTARLVDEGQRVQVGQALIEISPDIDLAEGGGAMAERIADELDRRGDRLRHDLESLETVERQQAAALQRLIGSLERQHGSAGAEFELRRQQADAAERMLERIRPLWEKRTLSEVQVRQYEDQALNARALVESAARNRLAAESALAEARQQLESLPLVTAARRSDIEGALADVAQARARNLAQQAVLLRASVAGVVSAIAVERGQPVQERQRLLSIVPEQAELRAELWVPSYAMGGVAVGSEVAIRYHAFPHQTYGHQRGRVVGISGSPLAPEEVRGRSGIDPGQPAFRILVALDGQGPRAERHLALRAGMTLDADLIQQRRRLYQWLFAPLGVARPEAPFDRAQATTAAERS